MADVADLLHACLVALRVPEHADAYRPTLPKLWRVQDALARITRLLAERPKGGELAEFLPPVATDAPERELCCRAAVASTLVAGLELARSGALVLVQKELGHAVRFCHAATSK